MKKIAFDKIFQSMSTELRDEWNDDAGGCFKGENKWKENFKGKFVNILKV